MKSFLKSSKGKDYLLDEYIKQKKSIAVIATEYGTYPNAIRRALLYHKIDIRDKSQAQKVALEEQRHTHPTEGKQRPESVKNKIGETMSSVWENLSEDEYLERCQISKDKWDKMTDKEKEELRQAAHDGIRRASIEGSEIEQSLFVALYKAGYKVNFHEKLLLDKEMHVDIHIIDMGTVIEIDGPTHFEPIWGEERLAKVQKSDREKNGLLLQHGYIVIRIKHTATNVSKTYKRNLIAKMLEILEELKSNPPKTDEDKFIEVEA